VVVAKKRNPIALVNGDLLVDEEVLQFRFGHAEWLESISGTAISEDEGKRNPIGVRPLDEHVVLIA